MKVKNLTNLVMGLIKVLRWDDETLEGTEIVTCTADSLDEMLSERDYNAQIMGMGVIGNKIAVYIR